MGKHLVARGVDGLAEILHAAEAASRDAYAPDVEAALASGHVADEVEPVAVGRDGGMGKAGERVAADLQFRWLAQGCVGALADGDLGVAGIGGVGGTLREIHLASIDAEGGRGLVEVGVEARVDGAGALPPSLLVLLADEDVGVLRARDAAQLVALRLVARGREKELVKLVAEEHRRVVGTAGVEDLHPLHRIFGSELLDARGVLGGLEALRGQRVVGHGVEGGAKLRLGLGVASRLHEVASQHQVGLAVVLMVADDVAQGGDGTLGGVDAVVAMCHLGRQLSALVAILGRSALVCGLKLGRRVIVLAQLQKFLALADVFVHTAGDKAERGEHPCCKCLLHHANITKTEAVYCLRGGYLHDRGYVVRSYS